MRPSIRLTRKVTLTFVLFAGVLLAIVGLLAYSSGRAGLEDATLSELLATATEKEAALETWLAEAQTRIVDIAASPFMRDRIAALAAEAGSTDFLALHDQVMAELAPLAGADDVYVDLLVLQIGSGQILAATDPSEEGTFKEDRPYFTNGKNGPFLQNVYFSLECQCPAITASAPVLSDDGQVVAVLAGRLNLALMGEIIARNPGHRATSDAFLVNTSSILVTQPRLMSDPAILQRGIRTEPVRQCLLEQSGSIQADDYRGVPVIAVYRWLPERNLCLVVKVDQAEAFQSGIAFGRTLLLTAVVALIGATIVAAVLARTITHPVIVLTQGVSRFGQGDLQVRLPEKSKDELGALAHEFNMMANAIAEKEALLQDYAKDLETRVAERTSQLTFLADASRLLSESFDYSDRLKQVAHLAVPKIADWCSVDILDENGILQRLAVVHIDPKKVELAYEMQRRFPPDVNAPRGTYNVIRTGKSEFFPFIPQELLTASTNDPEILDLILSLGLRSAMTVPLLAHGRALGTLSLVMAESGRNYQESDLALAEDLARRAALLIDNARLYREAQDINAQLEQRVEQRTAQLTTANRELEAFSYSVSHDLRAPLRALDGFSQILEEDYAEQIDGEGKAYLERIRAGTRRMGQLIDDLLEFSRLTRTEMRSEKVNLSAMAQQSASDLREQYPGHPVEFEAENGLVVTGDTRLLRVALNNMLGNAWKYTTKQTNPKIAFGTIEHNGSRAYYVRDNGAGFDMTYADKLFGVFQRLHSGNEFPGNGIGLATVQRIVHRHGGEIWADAAVGQGATFYFTL